MPHEIAKTFRFDAAHRLDGLPDDHPCGRLHGHTYKATVVLRADRLTDVGFVRDFGDLAGTVGRWIDEQFDHRFLNDVVDVPTTAEHLARYIYERWVDEIPELAAVVVNETASTYAKYEP